MGVQELRAESQRRGLGTARARADLIQRLTDHDAQHEGTFEDDFTEGVVPSDAPAELTASAETGTAARADSSPAPIRAFRKTFTAEFGGPDEETHLAYREATRQAAVEAGLIPRGDARLAEAGDGVWVYEISVRQVT